MIKIDYITIAGQQYYTTKDMVKNVFRNSGFNVVFNCECVNSRFRKGYYNVKVTHGFKCFADKLKASRKVKLELDKLEVV